MSFNFQRQQTSWWNRFESKFKINHRYNPNGYWANKAKSRFQTEVDHNLHREINAIYARQTIFCKSLQASEIVLSTYLNEYEATPWTALKYLIGTVFYGGNVTDVWDKRLLDTYVNQFFNEDAITTPTFYKFVPPFYKYEYLCIYLLINFTPNSNYWYKHINIDTYNVIIVWPLLQNTMSHHTVVGSNPSQL